MFRVVVVPLTTKSPVTVSVPPTVTLSGRPTVIDPVVEVTSISFAVPVRLVTPLLLISTVSLVAFPVSVTPVPAVNVSVSLLLSATIVVAPTTTFLKMFCDEPKSLLVIVTAAPSPPVVETVIPVPATSEPT